MNKVFVDANVFLRFLTNDIPEQASLFRELVIKCRNGEMELCTNEIVIAEIVWTLKSFYNYDKRGIKEIVSPIVASGDLRFDKRTIILNALADMVDLNVDYNDAYIHCWMQENEIDKIASFNEKHFKRFKGIELLKT